MILPALPFFAPAVSSVVGRACVEEVDVSSDVELLEEMVDNAIGKTTVRGRGQYC